MNTFNQIYSFIQKITYFRSFSTPREKLGSEKVLIDGRSLSQSVVVVDNPKERFKGLKGSDFALENQLSAGVQLKSCKFSPSLVDAEASIKSQLSSVQSKKVTENED